jgi:putative ABC transport system permease protein
MLIIAFGIMALVGILTAIDSILSSLQNSFSGLGANSFAITQLDTGFGRRHRGPRQADGKEISFDNAIDFQAAFESYAKVAVSATAFSNSKVTYESKKTNPNIQVTGINDQYLDVNGTNLETGRSFSSAELLYGANVCIIGKEIVKLLFSGNSNLAIDKVITINANKFKVVGVLTAQGASMTSTGDNSIYIPLLTQRKYFAFQGQDYDIKVAIPSQANLEDYISQATMIFRNIRKLRVVDANNFSVEKSEAMMDMLKENTATLRIATICIGLITLIGAAIGLMNIMLVSVTDRTREIGIRKALGATKKNILTQFLIEAIIICQIGGLIGIGLGILAGNAVSMLTGSAFIIPWLWITVGIILCLIVGLIAGIYPALKAANLDPVESLRYE